MIILDTVEEGVRRWRAHGESLVDVVQWIRNTPRKWTQNGSDRSSGGSSWDLNTSWEQTLKLCETGWSEGAKDLHNRISAHLPPRDRADTWRYDVAGERPDVGRFLSGDPCSMMRHGHPKGHRSIISIAIGANGSANVTAQQMANYGAAMVSMIDQIEAVGRRCDITATYISSAAGGMDRICPTWSVKKSEDSLDLAALAFSLAHPAAFRRIGFAMYERSDLKEMSGYGRSDSSTMADLVDPMPGTLVISGLGYSGSQCNTIEGALAFAANQINKAAGETLVEVEG